MIYEPQEDSIFFKVYLEKYLKENKINSFLEIGTGSGILAKTASRLIGPEKITASDINPKAIEALKNEKFKTIHSSLFQKIKGKFDLIIFNAPYLPLNQREPKDSRLATTGGEKGEEAVVTGGGGDLGGGR